jgi:hypothetical protein
MNRLLVWALLCHFGTVAAANARLGETLSQCVERYGPLVEKRSPRIPESDPDACVFTKAGISIVVEYRSGIAWNIRYRTPDLIIAQVTELLKANMIDGGGWSPAYEVAGVQYRLSTDRRYVAAYDPGRRGDAGILEVSTQDFNLAWRKHYAAKLASVSRQAPPKAGTKDLKGF